MRDFKKEQLEFSFKLKERMREKGCTMYVAYIEVCKEMEKVKEKVEETIKKDS